MNDLASEAFLSLFGASFHDDDRLRLDARRRPLRGGLPEGAGAALARLADQQPREQHDEEQGPG